MIWYTHSDRFIVDYAIHEIMRVYITRDSMMDKTRRQASTLCIDRVSDMIGYDNMIMVLVRIWLCIIMTKYRIV